MRTDLSDYTAYTFYPHVLYNNSEYCLIILTRSLQVDVGCRHDTWHNLNSAIKRDLALRPWLEFQRQLLYPQ